MFNTHTRTATNHAGIDTSPSRACTCPGALPGVSVMTTLPAGDGAGAGAGVVGLVGEGAGAGSSAIWEARSLPNASMTGR
jgi:hypothetical protein